MHWELSHMKIKQLTLGQWKNSVLFESRYQAVKDPKSSYQVRSSGGKIMLSFKQICNKVFPNKRLSPKCSLCNSTYVWLCLEGKPHKHTGSDGNRRQCLHGIATGGFFGQQYFRDAYRVCPESRKDMPSAMKHCQPWKGKYGYCSPTSLENTLSPLTVHTALLGSKPLCRINFDTSFFCSYCFVFASFLWLGKVPDDHFFSILHHSSQYGEWLTDNYQSAELNSSYSV